MNLCKKLFKKKVKSVVYYTLGDKSIVQHPERIINTLRDKSKIVIGSNTIVGAEIQILGHGGEVHIGNDCFIGNHTYIWSGAKIAIGNRVLIGHNCNIFDNDIHPIDDYERRHKQYLQILSGGHPKEIELNDQEVTIEDDVWIGANVTVLKGVRIGKCSVIGAGSVVTKDIEAYSVNAGNPCREIRKINGH